MPISSSPHISNPNTNSEGGKQPSEFDLVLSSLPARHTYELHITSKIVIDFEENTKSLPKKTQDRKYRENWAKQLKQLVERKWGRFRLVDRRSSTFFVRININCVVQTPESKTSDYHIWVQIHKSASYMRSPQPSFYRGTVWYLQPSDVQPHGNAAHEFGHMIGINHHNNRDGDRLMYGNDRIKTSERNTSMIKNDIGYVYSEIDLDFHRDWALKELKKHNLVSEETQLYFEPSRRK